MGRKAQTETKKCLQKEPYFASVKFLCYFYGMNKLMSYMLPGLFIIVVFSLIKTFFVSPDVAYSDWFVLLSAIIAPVCVIVPCVIYYLRTPPGVDHR